MPFCPDLLSFSRVKLVCFCLLLGYYWEDSPYQFDSVFGQGFGLQYDQEQRCIMEA